MFAVILYLSLILQYCIGPVACVQREKANTIQEILNLIINNKENIKNLLCNRGRNIKCLNKMT